MNSKPSTQDVEAFVVESLEAIMRGPHHFVGSASALDALLFGLDAVRRFCKGDSINACWNGFNSECHEKGLPETNLLEIVRTRLELEGEVNPSEQKMMNRTIEIWREVTGV